MTSMRLRWLGSVGLGLALAGCGGASAPPSSVPAASAPASAKPAGSAAPAASAAAASGKFIVSAGNVTMSLLPTWVAMDAGIFQKNGLNVDLQMVSGGINAAAALI